MRFILLILTLFSFSLLAHEELEPRSVQETVGSSFALPFFVSTQGEVSFLKNNLSDAFSFSPIMHAGANLRSANYVLPERSKSFSLSARDAQDRWLLVKRQEISAGLGLNAVYKNTFKLGLVPFKGAKQRLVKISNSTKQGFTLNLLPQTLKEIEKWSIGDQGTFERFGGIEVIAGGVLNLADVTASLLLQNTFIIEMTRISQDEVSLSLIEKSDRNRIIGGGISLATFAMSKIQGKTLGSEFVLDLTNPEHHELYQAALSGRISLLQERLPYSSQQTSWNGTIKNLTLGFPLLAGKNWRQGRVEMEDKTATNLLVFNSQKSKGFFLPFRDIHRMLYFSPRQMVLFWSGELKKVNSKLLDKRFLSIGRKIGVDGFDVEIDPGLKMGSAMTQLGVTFNQSELALLTNSYQEVLNQNYLERCLAFGLKCQKAHVRQKVLSKLFIALSKPWIQGREDIGKLLVKNPSLINSVIKTLKLAKKGYFYLLSDTMKSTEGMGDIMTGIPLPLTKN